MYYKYKTRKSRYKPNYAKDITDAVTPFVFMGAFTVILLAIITNTF